MNKKYDELSAPERLPRAVVSSKLKFIPCMAGFTKPSLLAHFVFQEIVTIYLKQLWFSCAVL